MLENLKPIADAAREAETEEQRERLQRLEDNLLDYFE